MNYRQKTLAFSALLLVLAACGGGGGGGGTTPQQPANKAAIISFSVTSTARLSAPVQGVQLSAYVPTGVTVNTVAASSILSSAALYAGSGITGTIRQVYGSYSAPIRKVKITVVTSEETFRGGEFAKLTVSYPATTTMTVTDFISANEPSFPFFEAGGYVVGSGSVDLTDKLRPSLDVVFN